QAREDMRPHQEEAERARAEVVSLKEKLKVLKADGADPDQIEKLETCVRDEDKAAREAQAKADAIDAAVFDLKAVNPNAIVKVDERTPHEVIQSIEEQGRVVAQCLGTLRKLLANGIG